MIIVLNFLQLLTTIMFLEFYKNMAINVHLLLLLYTQNLIAA